MGAIVMNGNYYAGNAGNTTRFINDTSNENYGWIQYKDENGEWLNYKQAVTTTYPIYMSSANEGGFEAYAGGIVHTGVGRTTPTITFGTAMDISVTTPSGVNLIVGSAISELIDLTNYGTIKFHHTSNGGEASINRYINFFITQTKENLMTAVVSEYLLYNQASNTGDVEIDISSLTGEYYIGFELLGLTSGTTLQTSISNMYME